MEEAAEEGKVSKLELIDGKGYVPAESVKDCIDTLLKLLDVREKPPYHNFTIMVGPETTCTVSFNGPVTTDEFQSLLAHLSYYKHTVIPGEAKKNDNLRGEIMATIEKMVA